MLGPLVAAGRRNRKKTRNCMKKAHARNEVWRQELPQAPTVEELSGMIVRGDCGQVVRALSNPLYAAATGAVSELQACVTGPDTSARRHRKQLVTFGSKRKRKRKSFK